MGWIDGLALQSGRNILAVRDMVHAMFMASDPLHAAFGKARRDEYELNGNAGHHPIFMGCFRARRWSTNIPRQRR
jgi:hypothetical protein